MCRYSEESKFTDSGTQRLTASWRAGASPSSRHRRTCFTCLQISFRCKLWYRRRGISTMFHGEEVDLAYLRVSGARTFMHIKNSRKLDARPGKGRCVAIARRKSLTDSGTQRLTASWRAGASPSSRPRLQSSLRCKLWYHRREISTTTLWTTTTFHTTTYCGM